MTDSSALETKLDKNPTDHATDEISSDQFLQNIEDDELPYSGHQRTVGFFQTFNNLFKTNYGLGILNLPLAFSRAGLIFGPIIGLILFTAAFHSQFMLVECATAIKRRTGKTKIGFAGTARYAFKPYFNHRSRYFVYVINAFIVSCQLGGCATYLIFTANSLYSISNYMFEDVRIWILILLPFVTIPALLAVTSIISFLSSCSNLLTLIGLITTFVYACQNFSNPVDLPFIGNFFSQTLFFTTILFMSKGTTGVLPIENEMKEQEKFGFALKISSSISIFIYILFGFFGYCAFGDQLLGSITLNLPNTTFYNCVKMVYALAIILTFFISFYIAMSVMIPTVTKITDNPANKKFVEYIFRFMVLCVVAIFSIVVHDIDHIISLIGALTCGALIFILPSIIHLATFWKETNETPAISFFCIVKDVLFILFGFFASSAGLYAAISNILSSDM